MAGKTKAGRATAAAGKKRPAKAETAESAIWAGEAASLVTDIRPAGDVVRELIADAAEVLRDRPRSVLRES